MKKLLTSHGGREKAKTHTHFRWGQKDNIKGSDNRKGNNRILKKKKKKLGKHITAHQKTLIRICVFLSVIREKM